jgi:hypothetical protein
MKASENIYRPAEITYRTLPLAGFEDRRYMVTVDGEAVGQVVLVDSDDARCIEWIALVPGHPRRPTRDAAAEVLVEFKRHAG